MTQESKRNFRAELRERCWAVPGVVVDFRGLGSRGGFAALNAGKCLDLSPVIMTSSAGLPVVAALVNGTHVVAVQLRAEVAQLLWMKYRPGVAKLGALRSFLYGSKNVVPSGNYPCVQLQRIAKQKREEFRKD